MHYQREKHRANPSRMHRNCKNYYAKNRIRIILNDARRRARKLRVPFNLDLSDIVVPTHCPVLGIELSTTPSMKTRDSAPSIDRMHAEFGYVQGNIRVISFRANRMKNDATFEEIEKLYRWMLKQQKSTQ
jgi:hypothetical protein